MNISNYIKNIVKSENQKIPDMFKQLEKIYKESSVKLAKSDLANSASRYLNELAQVKNLIELAKKSKLEDKTKYYTEKEKQIKNKLEEFGFYIK